MSEKSKGKGPKGAQPSSAESVSLSDQEVEQLRSGEFSASVVFHYLKTDYVRLQRLGLEERFESLGITIEGIYGAEFDASRQAEILNDIAHRDIDALVSIPIDQVATAAAYRTVANTGTRIAFIDNVPKGFHHSQDYAGTVSSDNRGLGIFAGRVLRDTVGSGTVGLITFDSPFYVTSAREQGALDILTEAADVSIVTQRGFTDPDEVYDITIDILSEHPDLDGLFVSWESPPGIQAEQATKHMGQDDIAITTTDISTETAKCIARDGSIKATGAQLPYQQGHIEANMIGHSLLGNDTPQFIASGVLPIHRENLLDLYPEYFQESPPTEITEYY